MGIAARIKVYVQPRAARTAVRGMHDGCIKICLAAAPVDGAANAELVAFLAQRLGVARSCVSIVAGGHARRKVVEIQGLAGDAVMTRIGADLGPMIDAAVRAAD